MSEEGKREWALMKTNYEQTPPTHDEVFVLLAKIIVNWNNLETLCRHLLNEMCGRSDEVKAVTAEVSTFALANALEAVARIKAPNGMLDDICYLSRKFDFLKNYRNHYVHGASYSGSDGNSFGLNVKRSTAKRYFKVHDHIASPYQMYLVAEAFATLGIYAADLNFALILRRSKEIPYTSQQKPQMPKLDEIPHRIVQGPTA